MTDVRYNWQRYVAPSDTRPPLTAEGYLDPSYGSHSQIHLKQVGDLVSLPCVVLLGEMGIGKSAVLEDLKGETESRGKRILSFALRPYTNEQWLLGNLFSSPQFSDWQSSADDLHIFLDGFDECPTRVPALGALIADNLATLPAEALARLSIRIACRAVEWRASRLEEQFGRLWGNQETFVYTVAPLREEDVEIAASARFSNPQAFMEGLRLRRCVPLAARPMTLRLLLDVYEEHQALPSTQKDLYEQACILLCEDQRLPDTGSHLDSDARLQVASRIACIMMLTNKVTAVDGPSTYRLQEGDLPVQRLVGGSERVAGQTLTIAKDEVRQALSTGLFAPSDGQRFSWFHRSVMEYLTARYLAGSGLSVQQVFQLLEHPADTQHRVVPHFHAVAAQYAMFERRAFYPLLDNNIEVLLNADLSVTSPEERASLVDALMSTSSDARWRRLNGSSILPNLAHQDLAKQLSNYITDRNSSRDGNWLVVDIAKATGEIPNLEAALIPLILDSEKDINLRIHCAYALVSDGTDEAKRHLLPLALLPNDQDSDDELKGCALRATWPHMMSAGQLFDALTPPKNPNLFGAYSFFLHRLAEDICLEDKDVPVALRWATSNRAHRFGNLIEAIKRRAWTVMEQPSVADLYAQLVALEIGQMSHLDHGCDDEEFAAFIAAQREGRRDVVKQLVPLLRAPPNTVTWILYGKPSLLDIDDFAWLLDCLALSEPQDIGSWLELIRQFAYFGPVTMMETIYDRCETIPSLRLAFSFHSHLASPETEKIRTDWYHSEQMRRDLVLQRQLAGKCGILRASGAGGYHDDERGDRWLAGRA